jgi:hypothetical protein
VGSVSSATRIASFTAVNRFIRFFGMLATSDDSRASAGRSARTR